MSHTISFTKMVGTGNDFVIVDSRRLRRPRRLRWADAARAVCDRHRGIGADGLLVLERASVADVRMRMFNPDGSEARMCGNGARCVARYLAAADRPRIRPVTIETRAGVLSARVRGHRVAMRMTDPCGLTPERIVEAEGQRFRLGSIDTGVPHAVLPVRRLDAVDVDRLGRALRRHPAFGPRGTNVNFIQPDPEHSRVRIRTYERGVEGETRS